MARSTKAQQAERAEAIAALRDGADGIKPGEKIYTDVRHVSRSGMQRSVAVFRVVDGSIRNISWRVAKAIGWRFDSKREAIIVDGCGMDMCFHTVYTLGWALFPTGGPLEASNPMRQHQEKAIGRETDGGYLLHNTSI